MENYIEKQIQLAAPQARVWEALTDSRQFSEWFRVRIEEPFVTGKSVSGQILHPGYEYVRLQLDIQAVEPQEYFSYTWHPYAIDPNVDYTQETPTLVEFRLSTTEGGTLLTVKESGFENIPESRRAEAFRMNTGGWTQQMKNIEAYVHKTS